MPGGEGIGVGAAGGSILAGKITIEGGAGPTEGGGGGLTAKLDIKVVAEGAEVAAGG